MGVCVRVCVVQPSNPSNLPPYRDSKWQSLTRHNVPFAVPSQCTVQLNEICFYIFSINSLAPSCHNWITLLAQKFSIKMVNGFTQRLKLRFTVSAIYGKCQNRKKTKVPLANATNKFKGKAELKNCLDF